MVNVGLSPLRVLEECEGDCDSDAICQSGLACFHRGSGSDPIPPGCVGTPEESSFGYDYCYDPSKAAAGVLDFDDRGEFGKAAPDSTVKVSIDLSSRWVLGIAAMSAVLLLMNLWRMARSDGGRKERKYAKVAFADSEEFTEHEAEAINVEEL